MQDRRVSDKKFINRVTDNVYFRFTHQAVTIIAPFFLAIIMHICSTYTDKIDHMYDILTTKVATYDQHFVDEDRRIGQLEDMHDFPHGRMR